MMKKKQTTMKTKTKISHDNEPNGFLMFEFPD
jgi:hypothetical protein